jgi:hypothetical protein
MQKRRGEIVAVKDLFLKYRQTLQAPQKTVELEAIKVIGEITSIKLTEHQMEYTVSSKTLFVNAPSMIKQEIRLKNKQILEALKNNLGIKSAPKTLI